ncbi:MAG: hypothetical protein ACTSW6_04340 [Candidatus Baldrarchaeia archaeon]
MFEKRKLKVTDKYTGEVIVELDIDSIGGSRRRSERSEMGKNISDKRF